MVCNVMSCVCRRDGWMCMHTCTRTRTRTHTPHLHISPQVPKLCQTHSNVNFCLCRAWYDNKISLAQLGCPTHISSNITHPHPSTAVKEGHVLSVCKPVYVSVQPAVKAELFTFQIDWSAAWGSLLSRLLLNYHPKNLCTL